MPQNVNKKLASLGRELEAHVTIKYGLLTDDAKHVRRAFNNAKPFKIKLGKIRHFEPKDMPFDVVCIEVISEDLEKANKMICEKFECAKGLPADEYKPHITIAYVKRGEGKNYIGSTEFEGKEITIDTLVFSPHKGNKTFFSVNQDKESSFILEKMNKFASGDNFLPSLFNAPNNEWQFEHGGDDQEIGVDPDPVSDETTWYAPCTEGKPRTKEVWRQFMSMFKNPFSKKEEMTINSDYDPEMDEKEKQEMGLSETQLEYSKEFYDPKKHDFPHNTQWFQNYQGVQEPDKVTPVTYSPEMNPEFDKQNSPGGYPNRFCRKPESEWFSDEGEVVPALQNMWKYRNSVLDNMTIDITASYGPGYWIDPNGKAYQVRDEDDLVTHRDWIERNKDLLVNEYGIKINNPDRFGYTYFGSKELVENGWTRVGDSNFGYIGIDTPALTHLPSSLNSILDTIQNNKGIILEDLNENHVELPFIDEPFNGDIQKMVNKALSQKRMGFSKKDLEKIAITRQYALYVGGRLAIRTLTRQKAMKICQEKFPEAFAKGDYQIKEEAYKVSKQAEIIEVGLPYVGAPLRVIVNPTPNEAIGAARRAEHGLRYLVDDDGNTFIWNSWNATHNEVAGKLIESGYHVSNTDNAGFLEDVSDAEEMFGLLGKQAGDQSASVPDYLINEWKTDQINNDTDEEPYVNHDQRDTSYGYHDSPEDTAFGIGWNKDNQPSVVHLDTLENPAYRLDPFGIGSYNVEYYTAMPASDGLEATNPD